MTSGGTALASAVHHMRREKSALHLTLADFLQETLDRRDALCSKIYLGLRREVTELTEEIDSLIAQQARDQADEAFHKEIAIAEAYLLERR